MFGSSILNSINKSSFFRVIAKPIRDAVMRVQLAIRERARFIQRFSEAGIITFMFVLGLGLPYVIPGYLEFLETVVPRFGIVALDEIASTLLSGYVFGTATSAVVNFVDREITRALFGHPDFYMTPFELNRIVDHYEDRAKSINLLVVKETLRERIKHWWDFMRKAHDNFRTASALVDNHVREPFSRKYFAEMLRRFKGHPPDPSMLREYLAAIYSLQYLHASDTEQVREAQLALASFSRKHELPQSVEMIDLGEDYDVEALPDSRSAVTVTDITSGNLITRVKGELQQVGVGVQSSELRPCTLPPCDKPIPPDFLLFSYDQLRARFARRCMAGLETPKASQVEELRKVGADALQQLDNLRTRFQ